MRKLILILSFGLIAGTCHGMSLYAPQDSTWTLEKCRIVFGKEYIPVSDQYKSKFQEYLDKNFL